MPLLPTNLSAGNTGHIGHSNQAYSKLNDFPNVVRDFGADNTGSADVQTAFDNCESAAGTCGTMVVPAGIYKFNNTWNITTPGLTVAGMGFGGYGSFAGSVLKSGVSGMTMVKYDEGSLGHTGPTFSHLNFYASTGHTGVVLLNMRRINRWATTECYFNSEDAGQNTGLKVEVLSLDNDWWNITRTNFRRFAVGCEIEASGGRFWGSSWSGCTKSIYGNPGLDSCKVNSCWFDGGQALVTAASGTGMRHTMFIGNGYEADPPAAVPPAIAFGEAADSADSLGNFIAWNDFIGKGGSQDMVHIGSRGHGNVVGPNWFEFLGTGRSYDINSTTLGNQIFDIDPSGTGGASNTAQINLKGRSNSNVNILLNRLAGQTDDMLQTLDSDGTTKLSRIDAGGHLRPVILTTANLPSANAAWDGRIIIEDNGTGDRNLIIYAGGQRFRIDGGAAF